MNIKEKLTNEEKSTIATLNMEMAVLRTIAAQREAALTKCVGGILDKLGLDKEKFIIFFNPAKDVWEAKLKDGVIMTPADIANQIKRP